MRIAVTFDVMCLNIACRKSKGEGEECVNSENNVDISDVSKKILLSHRYNVNIK